MRLMFRQEIEMGNVADRLKGTDPLKVIRQIGIQKFVYTRNA